MFPPLVLHHSPNKWSLPLVGTVGYCLTARGPASDEDVVAKHRALHRSHGSEVRNGAASDLLRGTKMVKLNPIVVVRIPIGRRCLTQLYKFAEATL